MVKNAKVGAVRVDEAMGGKGKKIGRAERQPLRSPEESRMRSDLGESFHRRARSRVAASLLVGPLRKSACTHSGGKPRVLFIYFVFPRQLGAQAFPHGYDTTADDSLIHLLPVCFSSSGRLVIA